MPAPTTLITFKVQVPGYTRTVDLFGSWDNFSRPHAMKRDTQLGPGEWTGCHTFSNIICDGDPTASVAARQGGLRQGGRYWYYYRLDDEIDDYNRNERSTTSCPLLPGQIVNIMHIPYVFGRSRSRSSSTSSEQRTMNPDDRYMNPRPVPARPVERVSTSPNLASSAHGTHSVYAGSSLASLWLDGRDKQRQFKHCNLTKKSSIDSLVPSLVQKTGGLRAAIRARTARSRCSDEPSCLSSNSIRQYAVSEPQSRDRSRSRLREPMLRSEPITPIQTVSFEQHRRRRSTSMETAFEQGPFVETSRQIAAASENVHPHESSDTPAGIESSQLAYTVVDPSELFRQDLDIHKRLPTLPNTPSSAYPPSLDAEPPERRAAFDEALAQLESHFSVTTIDTEGGLIPSRHHESSRFSTWTTSTGIDSVLMDHVPPALPPLDYELFGKLTSGRLDAPFNLPALSIDFSRSSISSPPSTSWLDTDDEVTSAHDMQLTASASKSPRYNLPLAENSSTTTLKLTATFGITESDDLVLRKQTRDCEVVHSENMQSLLDELGYLGGIIQQ